MVARASQSHPGAEIGKLDRQIFELECEVIREALRRWDGNKMKAAAELGISLQRLRRITAQLDTREREEEEDQREREEERDEGESSG